ncbi:hypothetical protein NHF46_04110 [Arthrobacter alpinus]|nr:hypothetical protein [Arthrobacter alpinus]
MYGDDSYYRSFWQHSISAAIPAGTGHDILVSARLRRTASSPYSPVKDMTNAGILSKSYDIYTIVRVTPPTSDDTNADNNFDTADKMRLIRVHTNSNTASTAIPGAYNPLPQVG